MGDRGKLGRLGKFFSLSVGVAALCLVLAAAPVMVAAAVPPNNTKLTTKTELLVNKKVVPMLTEQSAGQLESLTQRYRDIVANGGFPKVPSGTYRKGKQSKAIAVLNSRLYMEGYLRIEATQGEFEQVFTTATEDAVLRYQRNLGLEQSGRVDAATLKELNVPAEQRLRTMEANIERLRVYAQDLGPRYLVVNVPSQQIESVSGGYVYSIHNAVVGRPDRPTPVVAAPLSDVIFNPYWNAPASIVQADLIPKLLSDPNVLDEMNIKVFQGVGGPEVDPRSVNWRTAIADQFHFRQEPGPTNAMATAKINFPSPFGIYLHDTPDKFYFKTGSRYYSSGCVRIENVAILLNWIVNGQEGIGSGEIANYAKTLENREVKLVDPPQLRVTYLTAWPVGNTVAFREDAYELDGSGFTVGQPLPVGEMSEEGQRFVLKPVPHKLEAVDAAEFGGGGLFSFRSKNKQYQYVSTVSQEGTATPRKRRSIFGGLYDDDLGAANAAPDEPAAGKKLKKSKSARGFFDWETYRNDQKKQAVKKEAAVEQHDDAGAVAKKPGAQNAGKKPACKPGADGKLPKDCPVDETAKKKPDPAADTAAN